MKPIFLFFLLLVPAVMAIYGGKNTTIEHGLTCDNYLTVNVTGELQIDDNEYNIHNCQNLSQNYWKCNCSDIIILETQPNTLNNYNLSIRSYHYTTQLDSGSSSSSSGSSYSGGTAYSYYKKKLAAEEDKPKPKPPVKKPLAPVKAEEPVIEPEPVIVGNITTTGNMSWNDSLKPIVVNDGGVPLAVIIIGVLILLVIVGFVVYFIMTH